MSFKTKKEGRSPTTADCADAMAETDWALLKLTLTVREVDYLIAKDKRKQDNFGKPWYKKNWFPLWPIYFIAPVFQYLMGSMLANLSMAFIDLLGVFVKLIAWILVGALVIFLIYAILLA